MSLLRHCSRLLRVLPTIPHTCQVIIPPKPLPNPSARGYVVPTPVAFSSKPRKSSQRRQLAQISELESHLLHLSVYLPSSEIPLDHLLSALRLYSSLDEPSPSAGLFLLSCCQNLWAPPNQDQQKLTQQIWKLLTKKCANLTLDHYHTLLHVCVHNRTPIDPKKFLDDMKTKPEEETFVLLLKLAGKTGDLHASAFILSKMKDLGILLSPPTLRSLLEVYLASGDVDQALRTISSFRDCGIEPDSSMFACLAHCYASQGDVTNVLKYSSSYSFENSDLISIINALSTSTSPENVIRVLKTFGNEFIVKISKDPSFRATIGELVGSGRIQDASSIIKYLINCDNKLMKLVAGYLRSLISREISQEFIMREFKEFREFVDDAGDILIDMCEESLRCRKELSLMIIGELRRQGIAVRPHYFWPLIVDASSRNQTEVFGLIEEMGKLNVGIDHETLRDYVLPGINLTDASVALRRLKNFGIKQPMLMTSMICYLLENGSIKEATALVESTESRIDYDKIVESLIKSWKLIKNVDECSNVLRKAPKSRDYAGEFLLGIVNNKANKINEETVRKFVESFKKRNIVISACNANYCAQKVEASEDVYNALRDVVDDRVKKSNVEMITGIVHPREMKLEGLECHLIELKTKNMNYSGVLRKLFIGYCKEENVERVEEIRREFEAKGKKLTASMKAHLFELYAKVGRIGDVCELLMDLKENHGDFKIDSFKILIAAKALVEKGKVQAALAIVEENGDARWTTNYEGWMLLDAICRSDEAWLVEKTLEVLVDKKFCEIDSKVLGPLVRRFMVREEWENAVEEFERVFEVYEKLVMKQELVEGLIGAGREDLAGRVVEMIAKVKGEAVGKQYLVGAYGKLGRKKELRELLRSYGSFQTQFLKLNKNADAETKLKVLSNILEASEEISNFDRENIYELLLSCHIKTGDHRGVRDLWDKVTEDLNSSKLFKQKFLRLIESQQIPLQQINEKI